MKKKSPANKIMKEILVILPNNLGDVITTLPVLEALKKKYPESMLSFFVEEGFEGGLINYKYCDNIVLFKRKKIRNLLKSNSWLDGIKILKESVEYLKGESFDLVINLSQIGYISYLVSLLENKNVIGQRFLHQGNHCIKENWSAYLYAIPFARYFNSLHVTDIYKRIADVSDIENNSGISIDDKEKEKMREYVTYRKKEKSPIVIFQPGAAYESKRWPIENFIILGKKLIDDGYTIFVTGDASERNLAQVLYSELGENCIVTSGDLSFRECIALISFSEICITSDTAVMHVAASLSKKVFAIFGPTNPVETGPYSSGNIVFSGRCNKRPCFCIECDNKICMKSISPHTVYSYIKGTYELNVTCDIYRTTFMDGVYKLVPIVESGQAYYSESGASVVRKSLENHVRVDRDSEEYAEMHESSIIFIKTILKMIEYLHNYMTSGSGYYIQKFESEKNRLCERGGINEFWAAMLNVNLNSIPVMNALTAVRNSIAACEKIITQIETALQK